TVEFELHRPLYDWCIREAGEFPSHQIEFARLNLTYTVMSKRKLLQMVQQKLVTGWDDPRMPTLAGMRRRGYTPEAIRALCERVGVAKADSVVDLGLLEYCVREDLNRSSPRVMAVLKPLKLVIENFPDGEVRELDAPLHPEDATLGARKLPFQRELYVERDDFREDPPKDWFRLAPGREVRLRYACLVKCTDVIKDASGEVVELRGTLDPSSWGGTSPDGRVVRGTLHWVSAKHALPTTVRLYDRLFSTENPGTEEGKSFLDEVNPKSLELVESALIEPSLRTAQPGARYQFERLGYFCVDRESAPDRLVWNRTVTLKDTWAKIEKKAEKKPEAKPAAPAKPKAAPPPEIEIDDFAKLDLRVAVVRSAGLVEGADKLIRVMVDLGEGRERQIFAGLRKSYPDPAVLVGERVIVIANLKPRKMAFGVSEGMILAAASRVIHADAGAKPGDKVS
ncbi:MAG TPA: methionine--tRNA ligase subunit beta, partial [Polyangia bacterium]|nr:methionine--tRNA ligase subunit beta [Polyangia bacterium]